MKQFFYSLLLCVCLIPHVVGAQSIVRDTELEEKVKEWSEPLILAAGLSPKSVNIIFVQDSGVNAFVAGGSNIFIYTGLIDRAENPEELLGVIAHELGHISGGHLIKTREALRNASYEAILGTVLGLGAAIATGDGNAVGAISSATQTTAQRRFLSHSRAHESSADQAGLTYLKKSNIDPKGLVSFFGKLEDQDLLPQTQQLEYVRTHPLTRNRVEAIQNRAKGSPLFGQGMPQSDRDDFARLKAKLVGFINPNHVQWAYDQSDQSIPALYAQSIADYRLHKKDDAIEKIDMLLAKEPKNPYFLELKAQMLLEFGDVKASLPYYQKSLKYVSAPSLIRMAYAHALIESATENNTQPLSEAVTQLKQASIIETRSIRIQRLLGIAYGRLGQTGKANLHLAEESLLKGQRDTAKQRLHTAMQYIKKGSSDWIRAQDILNALETDKS